MNETLKTTKLTNMPSKEMETELYLIDLIEQTKLWN